MTPLKIRLLSVLALSLLSLNLPLWAGAPPPRDPEEICQILFGEGSVWNPLLPSAYELLVAKLEPETRSKLGVSRSSEHLLEQALKEAANGYTRESLLLGDQGAQIAHSLFESHAISLHQLVTANWLRLLVDDFSGFRFKFKGVALLEKGQATDALKLFKRRDDNDRFSYRTLSPADEKKLVGLISSLPFSEQQYWEIEVDGWDKYVATLNHGEMNLLWQTLGQLRHIVDFDLPSETRKRMTLRLPSMGLLAAYLEAFSPRLQLDVQPMYSSLEAFDVVRLLHTNRRVVAIHHPALNLEYKAHSSQLRPFIFLMHDILHFVGGHSYTNYDTSALKVLLHFYELARSFNQPGNRLWQSETTAIVDKAWQEFEFAVGAEDAKELWKEWFEKFQTRIGDLVLYSSSQASNAQDIIFRYLVENNPLDSEAVNIFAGKLFLTHLWHNPELWQQLGVSSRQEVLMLEERLQAIETPYSHVHWKSMNLHYFIKRSLKRGLPSLK